MQPEAALAARICHDLITPLNAINLGLESLEISNDSIILEGIKESTTKANVILKYIRELFSTHDENFNYSTLNLNKIISEYLNSYKISFKLDSNVEGMAEIFGKLIMFSCIIAKSNMPFGGSVDCSFDMFLNEIKIDCRGKNISEIQISNNWRSEDEINSRSIFQYFWLKLQDENEVDCKITTGPDSVTILMKKIS